MAARFTLVAAVLVTVVWVVLVIALAAHGFGLI